MNTSREIIRAELAEAEREHAETPAIKTAVRVRLTRRIRELGEELESLDRALADRRSS